METEIITTPDVVTTARRVIADALARQADIEVAYFPNADQKLSHKEILATILWDMVTGGSAVFADGTEFKFESYSDWLSTVKYLSSHIDGPVAGEDGAGVNIFKVYVGVDVSRI
jgi:hypothetical protein